MAVTGVLPVVPTPFADGGFDRASFERLLDHALHALDGYTLLGSTGEAPSLTLAERLEIAEQALDVTPDDKAVVVGISHTSVEDSVRLARHAQEHGASAVLCSAPYYFTNTPDGVLRHLRRIDEALEVDLVLYDNPVATKTPLRPEWIVRWADELEHLRAVKLTDHDLSKVDALRSAGLAVLAGDDPILFHYLAEGVDGAMVIAPVVLPEPFRAAWELAAGGDLVGAMGVFGPELAPFIHAFGIGEEIATTKALLADLDVFASDELRSPLHPVDDTRRRVLREAYELGREAERLRAARAAEAEGVP
jgi:4-hydroxy-tetrahydrodipicolinate synthase